MVRSLYDVIPTVVGASLCIRLLEFQLPSTDTQSYDDYNHDDVADDAGSAEVVRLTDLVLDLFSGRCECYHQQILEENAQRYAICVNLSLHHGEHRSAH